MPAADSISPFRRVLDALGDRVRRHGKDKAEALCPGHNDHHPSLSLREAEDGTVLIWCHAGCGLSEILSPLGLRPGDLRPREGTYLKRSRVPGFVIAPRDRRPTDPETLASVQGRLRAAFLRDPGRCGHARALGVSLRSLDLLGTGLSGRALSFPMYGATANLVGIRYRHATGEKWAEPGSRNGFFLSLSVMNRRQRSLVLVEGATDLATILSLGIPGVGLSSASHPVDEILLLVRRFQTESVALLLDSDKAGRQAAQRIGATLFPHVSFLRDVLLPPGIKDVREWRHHSGLTTQQFLEHVRSTGPVRAEVL